MGAYLMAAKDQFMNEELFTLYMVVSVACLILIFLTALVAIILVLFQKSNSDGIQGITASSETFFGKNRGQSIESKLKKWTWICMIVLGVLSIAMYIINLLVQS